MLFIKKLQIKMWFTSISFQQNRHPALPFDTQQKTLFINLFSGIMGWILRTNRRISWMQHLPQEANRRRYFLSDIADHR